VLPKDLHARPKLRQKGSDMERLADVTEMFEAALARRHFGSLPEASPVSSALPLK
jgi:hypothetical protein